MIFRFPGADEPIDQGDIFDDCPLAFIQQFEPSSGAPLELGHALYRIIVLTQTCDLAQRNSFLVLGHQAQGDTWRHG
jgi:hypothetical protein